MWRADRFHRQQQRHLQQYRHAGSQERRTASLGGPWSNSGGTISVNNGTLNLGGDLRHRGHRHHQPHGRHRQRHRQLLDNTSGPLNLNAASGSWILASGGVIKNGVIKTSGGAAIVPNSGTLDSVTVNGDIQLGLTQTAAFTIRNDTVLNGNLIVGSSASSSFGGVNFGIGTATNETLSGNANITLGGTTGNFLSNLNLGVLTFGPNVAIHGKVPSIANGGSSRADRRIRARSRGCGRRGDHDREPAPDGQHQTRHRRGLSGSGVVGAFPRRRVAVAPGPMGRRGLAVLLGFALAGCAQPVEPTAPTPRLPVAPISTEQVGDLMSRSVQNKDGNLFVTVTPDACSAAAREVDPPLLEELSPAATDGGHWMTERGVYIEELAAVYRADFDAGAALAHARRSVESCRGVPFTVTSMRGRTYAFTLRHVSQPAPDIVLWSYHGADWACDNAYVAAHNAAFEVATCSPVNGYDVLTLARDALKRIGQLANTTA